MLHRHESAVRINREIKRVTDTLFGRSFWSRGDCVSTVRLDEAKICKYIQEQEKHEKDELTN
ncbi:MAG: transposase [Planctomycetes bacterium]|nr:transposase [Planctomycetota bacterium]